VEALSAYRRGHIAAFHTPGHKLGAGAPADLIDAVGERLFSADMGIANGLDDTQESGGVLRRAEDPAAAAWGARRSFFTPNGSSSGLQALVMAVAGPGEQVIVPRNAHKSLLAGLILSGAVSVFVEPTLDETWQVAVNVPLSRYVAALEAHSSARALFVTSPSYNGFCADVPGLAALAHAAGLPLVVDQAWALTCVLPVARRSARARRSSALARRCLWPPASGASAPRWWCRTRPASRCSGPARRSRRRRSITCAGRRRAASSSTGPARLDPGHAAGGSGEPRLAFAPGQQRLVGR
jgi:arginine/lysine/ornithine decarboxylase